jgi:hypothetical protein
VIELTDAQTWTVIGVLAAGFVGFMSVIVTLLNRTLSAELRGIRTELVGFRTEVELRFTAMERRMDGLERRMDGLETRMDGLDRDVQAIAAKVFGRGD